MLNTNTIIKLLINIAKREILVAVKNVKPIAKTKTSIKSTYSKFIIGIDFLIPTFSLPNNFLISYFNHYIM